MPDPIGPKAAPSVVRVSEPKSLPKGPSFAAVLARPVLRGAEAAASVLPGGPLVTAVAKGVASGAFGAPSSIGASGSSPASSSGGGDKSLESVMADSQAFNLYYLQLQEEMSAENRGYTALSNVLKARHDTVKNAIGNVR